MPDFLTVGLLLKLAAAVVIYFVGKARGRSGLLEELREDGWALERPLGDNPKGRGKVWGKWTVYRIHKTAVDARAPKVAT